MRSAPQVEVLSFAGCPNAEPAVRLVRRVIGELRIEADLQVIDVSTPEDAERLRFLGSPTIRVDGRDIEPGAQARSDYVFSCRVYRTADGFTGQPDERWLRDALQATVRVSGSPTSGSY